MGSLARKMQRANLRRQEPPRPIVTDKGIFCDCYGTLFSHSFEKDELLVAYLNAQYAAGMSVTLISMAPRDVISKIGNIGLHDDLICSLTSKSVFYRRVLEELIDDDPVMLKAQNVWHPRDAVFRAKMEKAVNCAPPEPRPAP